MPEPTSKGLDLDDADAREEILVRQRRDMWTPEQIASLARHFRLAPGQALLDAGCGYGYSLRTFGPFCMPGGRLVGVDARADLLETAGRLADEAGLGAAATFSVADVHALPFDEGAFDVVMAQVVLCHLDEPERALDELIRVTRPGGCVAVFDNAVGGCPWGWNVTDDPPARERVKRAEMQLLAHEGRGRLGRGDFSVGLRVPGWMEARGMRDVDARVNERVVWIAPPYRSPAQQTAVRSARESCEETGFHEMDMANTADELRAVGVKEDAVQAAIAEERERHRRYVRSVRDGTAAFSYGGSFWCIWGFKG